MWTASTADSSKRVAHSCQRWLRHGGCRRVVETGHGNVLGYAPAGLAQRRDDAERHEVRGGENGVDIGVAVRGCWAALKRPLSIDQSPSAERLARNASPAGSPVALEAVTAAAGIERARHGGDPRAALVRPGS